jgi:hypothetical protein
MALSALIVPLADPGKLRARLPLRLDPDEVKKLENQENQGQLITD